VSLKYPPPLQIVVFQRVRVVSQRVIHLRAREIRGQ
jgi:hypothetical protein